MLSLFHWLSIQGLFNGVLISLLVLRKRPGKSIQRVFVGLFFALVSLGMALILVQNSGWFTGRLLQHLELSFGLLVGPLVWLYFKNEGHQTSSLDLLHLLWPLVYWITVVAGDLMDFRPFKPELLLMIHFQVYVLVSCLTWPGIFQSIRSWTTMVAGVCILLGITQWVRFTYAHIALFDLIIPTCLGCCFYLVLIKLILVTKTPEREITKSKYSTQDIVALDNFMRQNQPYLNPGLKLFHLAHQTGYAPDKLSRVIKQSRHLSFRAYLNSWRICHAKSLLSDPNNHHLTLEGIGQLAGFHSRSSFYRIFKATLGQTPAEFKSNAGNLSH